MDFKIINEFEDNYFKYKDNLENFNIKLNEKEYLFLLKRYSKYVSQIKHNLERFELFKFLYSKNLFDIEKDGINNDLFFLNFRNKHEHIEFILDKAKKFEIYSITNNLDNDTFNQYIDKLYNKLDNIDQEKKLDLLIQKSMTAQNIFAIEFFINKSIEKNIELKNETILCFFFNHQIHFKDILFNLINKNKNSSHYFFNNFKEDNHQKIINSYLFNKDEYNNFFNLIEKNKIELSIDVDNIKNKQKRKM